MKRECKRQYPSQDPDTLLRFTEISANLLNGALQCLKEIVKVIHSDRTERQRLQVANYLLT